MRLQHQSARQVAEFRSHVDHQHGFTGLKGGLDGPYRCTWLSARNFIVARVPTHGHGCVSTAHADIQYIVFALC